MMLHDKNGFVFSRREVQKRLKILIFTCQKRAYVYFTQIKIGFVFHFFLPREMAAFSLSHGVNINLSYNTNIVLYVYYTTLPADRW